MKKAIITLCVVIGVIVLGLGIHWAVVELKSPVPNEDLVNYGTFVVVDGMKIHMEHAGAGTPIILIHGYTSTLYTWRFNVPALSKTCSVYTLDLPGFGYSDKPKEFPYTHDGYADFMVDYMDAMGIKKAVLVGNSMGGGIAMMTTLRHPDRVEKLILVDSDGYPEEKGSGFFLFDLMGYPVIGDVLMSFNYRWVIKQSLLSGIYYNNRFVTDDVIDSYYNVYQTENGRKAPLWVGHGLYGDVKFDPEWIKGVSVPTLVIWGKDDTLIPVNQSQYFARDIVGANVVVLAEAGHLPHEEKADIFNALVAAFVKQK